METRRDFPKCQVREAKERVPRSTAPRLSLPEPRFLPASLSPTYRVSCPPAGPPLVREGDRVTAAREPVG